jgi:hypothetical protein
MLSPRARTRRGRLTGALATALGLAMLASCSGGGDSPGAQESTPAPTGGLTAPGTKLALDHAATVQFKDGPKRKSKIRVVVNGVQTGSIKDLREFDLTKAARRSGIFYVRATIRNIGHGDIGGAFVKLYGKVSDTLVVQPVVFGSSFGKCNYQPLPKPFGAGKRADVCMVMLAPRHGSLSAVEWRFDGDQPPVTWELP